MLFNPFFAVVQLPIYIFTISNCSSIGVHSNQPMKINFYHLKLPNFFMIKARDHFGKSSNKIFWLDPYMQCRYGRCLKKMLDFVQKCRGGYRGCCSVQDWLADVFVIIKVFGRQNNTIPEKWKHFVPKRRFLMNINNNKRVFLCVIPVQSRERVAKAKAKNGHKFQNSASKLK